MSVPYHSAAVTVNTLQVSCRFPEQTQVLVSRGISGTGIFSTENILTCQSGRNTDVGRRVSIKSEELQGNIVLSIITLVKVDKTFSLQLMLSPQQMEKL